VFIKGDKTFFMEYINRLIKHAQTYEEDQTAVYTLFREFGNKYFRELEQFIAKLFEYDPKYVAPEPKLTDVRYTALHIMTTAAMVRRAKVTLPDLVVPSYVQKHLIYFQTAFPDVYGIQMDKYWVERARAAVDRTFAFRLQVSASQFNYKHGAEPGSSLLKPFQVAPGMPLEISLRIQPAYEGAVIDMKALGGLQLELRTLNKESVGHLKLMPTLYQEEDTISGVLELPMPWIRRSFVLDISLIGHQDEKLSAAATLHISPSQ